MKRIIAVSQQMKGGLDNDYTLYDNGEVLHEYDRHIYPNGLNLKETLSVDELSAEVKQRLLSAASDENKELAKRLLKM
jgi:hypothetical protein